MKLAVLIIGIVVFIFIGVAYTERSLDKVVKPQAD